MIFWQQVILLIFALVNFIFFIKACNEIKNKNNAYGLTPYLVIFGSFVWGDMLILGPFWLIVVLVSIFLNNIYLFLLLACVFWVIRSIGEMVYWLNEQFAYSKRNPPSTLRLNKFIKSDAIWFIYQLFWQCVFVFVLVLTFYFAKMWLQSF